MTANESFSQDWALRDQMRRASVSVVSNSAEGFSSGSDAEFVRFLRHSLRSCAEVRSQLDVVEDILDANEAQWKHLRSICETVAAKAGGLIKYPLKTDQGTRKPS